MTLATGPTARSMAEALHAEQQRVAVALGDFDLLVPSMIRQLQKTRDAADALIVAVVADDVPSTGYRAFEEQDRHAQVSSLACVDLAEVVGADPLKVVLALAPEVLLIDEHWAARLTREQHQLLNARGTDIRAVGPLKGEARLQARLPEIDDVVASYMRTLRGQVSLDDVRRAVASLRRLHVLVVGDVIVDEYAYCRVSGTVTKYPALAAVYENHQVMAGGSAAIARHAAQLSDTVHFVSAHGTRDQYGTFIEGLLERDGITCRLVEWPDAYTVTKRRYITGGYPNVLEPSHTTRSPQRTRLFEVGFLPEGALPAHAEREVIEHLAGRLDQYDAVIVADFGHGLVTPQIASTIATDSRWWAVNAQTNSSNFGFNRITRHLGADFVCIDELEARLPSGQRTAPLEHVVAELRSRLGAGDLMVTRGRDGLILYEGEGRHAAPAIARQLVDTVGAGDAVLTCAALCRAAGVEAPLTVFLSSCAGALAAGVVGNETPVGHDSLLAFAERAFQ